MSRCTIRGATSCTGNSQATIYSDHYKKMVCSNCHNIQQEIEILQLEIEIMKQKQINNGSYNNYAYNKCQWSTGCNKQKYGQYYCLEHQTLDYELYRSHH
jgi:hypothetical protein